MQEWPQLQLLLDKSACVAGTYSNAAASQCSTAPAGRFASNSDNTAADVGAVRTTICSAGTSSGAGSTLVAQIAMLDSTQYQGQVSAQIVLAALILDLQKQIYVKPAYR